MDHQIEMKNENDILIISNINSDLKITVCKADGGFDIGFLDNDNNKSIVEIYHGHSFWNGKRISIQPK